MVYVPSSELALILTPVDRRVAFEKMEQLFFSQILNLNYENVDKAGLYNFIFYPFYLLFCIE